MTNNQLLPSNDDRAHAQHMAMSADAISYARPAIGLLLGNHILHADDYRSWAAWAIHAGVALGDRKDGQLKRAARAIDSTIQDNPSLDDLTDKGYFYLVTEALARREKQDGHVVTSWLLNKMIEINFVRDVPVTYLRMQAKKEDIKVNAGEVGKAKTLLYHIGTGTLLTPLAKNKAVKTAAMGLMLVGTGASILSGAQYIRRFSNEIKISRYAKSKPKY